MEKEGINKAPEITVAALLMKCRRVDRDRDAWDDWDLNIRKS